MSSEEGGFRPFRVAARIAFAVVAAILVLIGLMLLSGAVQSAFLRLVVGSALALATAFFGVGYFRQLAHPPPPDPEPADVHPSFRLAYVCEMCGMELAVLKVAREKAPKHCGEAMVLVRL